jgi:hypothetical protein
VTVQEICSCGGTESGNEKTKSPLSTAKAKSMERVKVIPRTVGLMAGASDHQKTRKSSK